MTTDNDGRIFREAWIAGVTKHYLGEPKAGIRRPLAGHTRLGTTGRSRRLQPNPNLRGRQRRSDRQAHSGTEGPIRRAVLDCPDP